MTTAADHSVFGRDDGVFAGVAIAPVTIRHDIEHEFKAKPKKPGAKKPPPGCALCNGAKTAAKHHGWPDSMRVLGSGNRMVYQTIKSVWQERWTDLLEKTSLGRPVGFIFATGVCCFPNKREIDQGNYRFMIEKSLGDALEEGGWLTNDDWSRYQFGDLAFQYAYNQRWTELTLYPEDTPRLLAGIG